MASIKVLKLPYKLSQELTGFIYVSLNSVLISISGILFASSNLTSNQMIISMSFLGLFIGASGLAVGNQVNSFMTRKHMYAMVNGLLGGGFCLFTYYGSMHTIGPSGAVVLSIFACIVTAFAVEKFQLKQTPHWLSIASFLLGFGGMVILCQKNSDENNSNDVFGSGISAKYFVGVVYGLLSGVLSVVHMTILKSLRSPEVPDLWQWIAYMLGGLIPSAPDFTTIYEFKSCELSQQLLGLCAALSQALGSLCLVKGMMFIKASAAFVFEIFSSVLVLILQIIFLPHLVAWFSYLGAVLIICAISLQLLVTAKLEKKPQVTIEVEKEI